MSEPPHVVAICAELPDFNSLEEAATEADRVGMAFYENTSIPTHVFISGFALTLPGRRVWREVDRLTENGNPGYPPPMLN